MKRPRSATAAYLQVFLTHSALERYMEIYGVKNISDLLRFAGAAPFPRWQSRNSSSSTRTTSSINFLRQRIDKKGKKIEEGLTMCKHGDTDNHRCDQAASCVLHPTANANGINPKNVNKACMLVSDFLLQFMDAEFHRKSKPATTESPPKKLPASLSLRWPAPKSRNHRERRDYILHPVDRR